MANLHEITAWCDNTLKSAEFKDYCPNGIQIEGKTEVKKILCAVSASQRAVDAAIEQGADVLLVHHGYFWKGEPAPLTGMKGKRVKALMQHDITLLAYHLPLDAHPTLGNNRAIADILDIQITGPLDPAERHPIGNIGMLSAPLSTDEFSQLIENRLGFKATHLPGKSDKIHSIGFCTGGAQDFIHKAHAQGCDAYISGEVSERTTYEAEELGIHYFACGHHATERYGVQRLAQAIVQQFEIECSYFELNNPI